MKTDMVQNVSFSVNLEETSWVVPNYSVVFPFEKNFEATPKIEWMQDHFHEAFYYIGIYLLVIFGGQRYMKNRPRMKLTTPLALWNVSLAVFSILGVIRSFPELTYILQEFGFAHSVCSTSYYMAVKVTAFWTWAFILSKVLELGDTIFIILRKQQLIFLHWYHHITVLLFTWYSFRNVTAPGRWYIFMNYTAHSMMYTYYALRSMKITVPRFITICITLTQILQMVIGFYVSYFGYIMRIKGKICGLEDDVAIYGMLMYSSYFVLFVRYFYLSYVTPRKEMKKVE